MRHLNAVLEDCERHGIHLAARGNGLEVRGPLARMPELREELSRHKPNILCVLRTGRCHHELPPSACKLCNGYVRQLIERLERQAGFEHTSGNSSKGTKVEKSRNTVIDERNTVSAEVTETRPLAELGEGENDV